MKVCVGEQNLYPFYGAENECNAYTTDEQKGGCQ
jgi:hypothetical protein